MTWPRTPGCALAVALVIGLRFSPAPRQAVRVGWLVLAIQGIVGYTQYFNHLRPTCPGRASGARLWPGCY